MKYILDDPRLDKSSSVQVHVWSGTNFAEDKGGIVENRSSYVSTDVDILGTEPFGEDVDNEAKGGDSGEQAGKVLKGDDGGEDAGGDIQDDSSNASSGDGIASVGEVGTRDGPNAGNAEVCVLSYGACGGIRIECHN